jgi:hypothetical protein
LDLTPHQADEFQFALDLMRLIDRNDGARRTVNGLNRAGQHRWPARKLWVGDTEILLNAWRIAGTASLKEVIVRPKIKLARKYSYYSVGHVLKSLAVVAAGDLGDDEEVFLPGMCACAILEHRSWSYYRVAAETNWGIYQFAIMNHHVPQWNDLRWFCRWHTRLQQ